MGLSLSEPQDAIFPRLLLPLKSLLQLRTLGISGFHSPTTVLLNRGTSEAGACLVSVPAAGCFHLHFVLCYRSWRLLYLATKGWAHAQSAYHSSNCPRRVNTVHSRHRQDGQLSGIGSRIVNHRNQGSKLLSLLPEISRPEIWWSF
jgi:hypothetical protein